MTRTLPWLKGGTSAKPARVGNPSSVSTANTPAKQPAPKRRRISTPPRGSDDDLDLNTTGLATPSRRRLLRSTRTPSTSPPPAPPDQNFMREGLSADDIWIMVEDEFYSTAQAYTTHLHHAEYQRLKKLASEREKVNNTHGTDGKSKMSADGAMALLREKRDKSVTDIMKKFTKAGEEESDEDDPWVGTQLAGLMDSPRKAQRLRAKNMGVGRSDTRAAKGFGRSETREGRRVSFDGDAEPVPLTRRKLSRQEVREVQRAEEVTDDENDDDEDDLDAPIQIPNKSALPRHRDHTVVRERPKDKVDSFQLSRKHSPSPRERSSNPTSITKSKESRKDHSPPRSILRKSIVRETAATNGSSRSHITKPAPVTVPDASDYGFGSILPPSQTTGGGFLARRKAEREKERLQKEDEERKKKMVGSSSASAAEVPTFLF